MHVSYKTRALLSLLPQRPQEFYDRVTTIAQRRLEQGRMKAPQYDARTLTHAISRIDIASSEVENILAESALDEIQLQVRQRLHELRGRSPFKSTHNAGYTLARCCYIVCRSLKPAVVLETGVAHGVTSAFILKALEQNGSGALFSVDLPPLGMDADRYVGAAIPPSLKGRWELHRGVSRRVLPRLLNEVSPVDVFVHDSLHTYLNMRWEFSAVLSHVRSGGVILADDIQNNRAFKEVQLRSNGFSEIIREDGTPVLVGIAIKQ